MTDTRRKAAEEWMRSQVMRIWTDDILPEIESAHLADHEHMAAIKDAEIAALRLDLRNAEGLRDVVQEFLAPRMKADPDKLGQDSFFLHKHISDLNSEIAALREAVREAYETMESCGHDNWCDWSVVRRALEEKP